MNQNNYCVIMAGGIGSRFWPLSRVELPKQFVDALGVGAFRPLDPDGELSRDDW